MMKKKNIAMVMAGVTVATSVAPVFASTAVEETNFTVDVKDQAKLISKVGELLEVKYTSELDSSTSAPTTTTGSVYEITVGGKPVTNKTDFKNKLSEAITTGDTLIEVVVTDKGHEVVGNQVNNYTTQKYDLTKLAEVAKTSTSDIIKSVEQKGNEVVITLTNDLVITLGVGNDVLDLTKAIDKDGNDTTTPADVVGFKKKYELLEEKEYTVNVSAIKNYTVTADELFDGVFLTEAGKALMAANTTETVLEIYPNEDEEGTIVSLDAVLTTTGKTTTSAVANGQIARVNITGEEDKLVALQAVLKGAETPAKIAGETRFDTAAMISKQYRTSGDTTVEKDSIVLTSAESLVDGLAAGPLAAHLDTSILLSNKIQAPEQTMTELAEALNIKATPVGELKDKTVYIVGGESVIGEEVVAQIKALGVTVERIAGNDRHETSLAVANKMVELGAESTEAFVVGATGEADAMSISSYAAQKKNPIIVSGFNSEVSEEALKFVADKNLTIIGGNSAVSTELEEKLDEANEAKTVERVKGETRFETNAAVINKFFRNGEEASQVFVAADGYKAGNDKLVDALTAAPLAAKANAPIVLATEEMVKDQEEALTLAKTAGSVKVVQVGGGVFSSVISKVLGILK